MNKKERIDIYCDTGGELIEALKKFPKDAQLYCVSGYKHVSRCEIRIHVEDVSSKSGAFNYTAVCLDTIEN